MACARLGYWPPDYVLDALVAELQRDRGGMLPGRHGDLVSELAWALASFQYYTPELWADLQSRLAAALGSEGMMADDVARSTWALAKLGLCDQLAAAAQPKVHLLSDRWLVGMLEAVARQGGGPGCAAFVEAAAEELLARVQRTAAVVAAAGVAGEAGAGAGAGVAAAQAVGREEAAWPRRMAASAATADRRAAHQQGAPGTIHDDEQEQEPVGDTPLRSDPMLDTASGQPQEQQEEEQQQELGSEVQGTLQPAALVAALRALSRLEVQHWALYDAAAQHLAQLQPRLQPHQLLQLAAALAAARHAHGPCVQYIASSLEQQGGAGAPAPTASGAAVARAGRAGLLQPACL